MSRTSQLTQRERDALRQELRLMASAYQMLSHRMYRESSWEQVAERPPASSTWLTQQRDALVRLTRP